MNIIDRILERVPLDKLTHFIAGFLIGILASPGGMGAPTAAAFLAGRAKEISDNRANRKAIAAGKEPPHSYEIADQVVTTAGGLAADLWSTFVLPLRIEVLAFIFTMI